MHAITKRIIFVALLASIASSQPTIKSSWTQINAEQGDPTSTHRIHADSFSDGRYIVVYPVIIRETLEFGIKGQIFYPNGSVAVSEFDLDPDQSLVGIATAPNVVVFHDDTFVITYIWDGTSKMIRSRRYTSDGTPLGPSFNSNSPRVPDTASDIDLIGFADKSFFVFYFSSSDLCIAVAFQNQSDTLIYHGCFASTSSGYAFSATNREQTKAYYALAQATTTDFTFGQLAMGLPTGSGSTGPITSTPIKEASMAILTGTTFTILYTSDNSIEGIISVTSFGAFSRQTLVPKNNSMTHSSPAVIRLTDSSVLMAYKSVDSSDNSQTLTYQTVDLTNFELNHNKLAAATNLSATNLFLIRGSDVLVVAKDPVTGNVMRQVITFCGNGQLELDEECEGGNACDSYCMCTNGLIGYNGVCGLPNVIPVLDCVQPVQQGNTLYFSFINQDRVVHAIGQGETNAFSPVEYGGNRPTSFDLGSTLTYPASPYSVVLPTSEKQMNWILGSYNLTVDLTDVTPLLCPDSLGLVTAVQGNLTNSSLLAQNFAHRYGLSLSRLNTSVSVYSDRYDVTIVVSPTDDSSSSEPNPVQAVRSAVEDFKNSTTRTDVTGDLLNGNDGTTIKDITPTPTGVEVRGTRYDSSNITPQSQSQSPQSTAGPIENTNNEPSINISSAFKLLANRFHVRLLFICFGLIYC